MERLEVIDDYRKPTTYKAAADLKKVENNIKHAMQEVGFNLKYVKDNPYTAKVASLQFKQLVRSMDRDHSEFLRIMEQDPSVDQEQLKKHFNKNYSDMLGFNKTIGRLGEDEINSHLPTKPLRPLDSLDRKRLQEGRL